jgi:hypothetical protein
MTGGAKPETRRKHLQKAIASGKNLQAAAYALAAGGEGQGRYLFIDPELDLDRESLDRRVGADDRELIDTFDAAVHSLLEAWDLGSFFPRLVETDLVKENPACEYCELTAACVRGDSGMRQRLVRWVEAREAAPDGEVGDPERALLAAWHVGARGDPPTEGS